MSKHLNLYNILQYTVGSLEAFLPTIHVCVEETSLTKDRLNDVMCDVI